MDLDVLITFDYAQHVLLYNYGHLDLQSSLMRMWHGQLFLLETAVLPLAEDTGAREKM